MDELNRALSGEEIPVDFATIERCLSELWTTTGEGEHGVTKAALWNVIAHAETVKEKDHASQILSTVSGAVPQRTILVNAEHDAKSDEIRAWISANCHLGSGGEKICSEEITIHASGNRTAHVPPIVNALLIPDMPVAAWWVGDLPTERRTYVDALLDPVDRLVVDSTAFDSVDDLRFLSELASDTSSRPADLNWSRIEDWRIAAASMFDVAEVRTRIGDIKHLSIAHSGSGHHFGEEIESRFFTAWMLHRLGYMQSSDGIFASPRTSENVELLFMPEKAMQSGLLIRVDIEFSDGVRIGMQRQDDAGAIRAEVSGLDHPVVTVTRVASRRVEELIIRELSRSGGDRMFTEILPKAMELSTP